MSGSSNSYMPEIKSSSNTDCKGLVFTTSLTSPVVSVIVNTKVGEVLSIELVSPSSLQVVNANGVLVGSLLTAQRDNIVDCINKGFEFIATVVRINGGNCDLRITCI